MEEDLTKRFKIKRRDRQPAARKSLSDLDGVRLVTPEGAPLVFAQARYRHTDPEGIRQILGATEDFDVHSPDESDQGRQTMAWLQTKPIPGLADPVTGQRVLANLTLTPVALEVEAMSKERLANCRKRLESLLGDRIRFESASTRSAQEALRDRAPRPEPEPPVQPPPEVLAELEEKLLRQWINDSIPALGGLTPLQAVKTLEGRQRVLELIAGAEQLQRAYKSPFGFAPDYRKAKKMLGLE